MHNFHRLTFGGEFAPYFSDHQSLIWFDNSVRYLSLRHSNLFTICTYFLIHCEHVDLHLHFYITYSTILCHYGLIYEHYKVLIKIRMLFMSISNIWNARIFKFTSCTNKLQQLNTSILGSFCLKRNNLTIIQQKTWD